MTLAAIPTQRGAVRPPCRLQGVRLELLASFVAVAEELHIGRAAERLFLTQSGLSRRLSALEQCLGTSVFTRTTRHIELSSAGLALLPHAKTLLQSAADASRAITQAK